MNKRKLGGSLMLFGAALVLCAAALIAYNRCIDCSAGEQVGSILESVENQMPDDVHPASHSFLSGKLVTEAETNGTEVKKLPIVHVDGLSYAKEMPTVDVEGLSYIGTIRIPAADISLPVLSKWDYDDARVAPCCYRGSVYDGSLIIAGHNYKSHFGRLSSLHVGAAVVFTDIEGNKYSYTISSTEIIGKYDVEAMNAGLWDLTLFTCTLGGKQRVTVRCVLDE